MDRDFNSRLPRLFKGISKRAQSLPYDAFQRLRLSYRQFYLKYPYWVEWRRPLGSMVFFLSALLLGYYAYGLAQEEADQSWHKNHRPSFQVIRAVFQSYGLKRNNDPVWISRIQRELPASLEEEGLFWITEQGNWIYSYTDGTDGDEGYYAFCRDCSKPPSSWKAMGKGWPGLEKAEGFLKIASKSYVPIKDKNQKPPPKGGFWRDSREIRF